MELSRVVWSRAWGARVTVLAAVVLIAAGLSGCGKKEEGLRMPTTQHDQVPPPDPEEILAMLSKFDCETRVVDDYLPNDFTMICQIGK